MKIKDLFAPGSDVLITVSEPAHSALWLGKGGDYARILDADERGALIEPVFLVGGKDEAGAPAYLPWGQIAAIKARPAQARQ